jgi:peptide/nickel transport system permease protein
VTAYLLRRIGTSIIVLVGVSLLIFLMLHAVFPSPARAVMGLQAKQVAIDAWNKEHGYDDPLIVQYLRYVGHLLKGDLGYSYVNNQPVTSVFAPRVLPSAYLSGMSLLLSILIGLPLGLYQAVRRNSVGDHVGTSLAFILYSMPVYLLGLLCIDALALRLHVFNFEASQSHSIWVIMGDWHSMTLPILTLTLVTVAAFSRYMRSSSIDVLAQDYVKVARAKGLPERLVLVRHIARNASLPMVTLIGLSLPALVSGNLITEIVFNQQGLGQLFQISLQKQDYAVLLAYTLIGALFVIVGNFIADLALSVADPRIRLA